MDEGGHDVDGSDVDEHQVHSNVDDKFELQELQLFASLPPGSYTSQSFFITVAHNTTEIPPPPPREKVKQHVIFMKKNDKWVKIETSADDARPAHLERPEAIVISSYKLDKRLKTERVSLRPPNVPPEKFRKMNKTQQDRAPDQSLLVVLQGQLAWHWSVDQFLLPIFHLVD